jgi:Glutathione S-transferase
VPGVEQLQQQAEPARVVAFTGIGGRLPPESVVGFNRNARSPSRGTSGRFQPDYAYMTGARFTASDAYAFTVLNWAGHLQVDLERWPNIRAFLSRVAARPRVREALKAEGLA